jgi:predicted DNA-binding antitoxin AbrB/MazE fold protein
MRQRVEALFENGLLRPLQPLQLNEHQRVSLTVDVPADDDWLDNDAIEWAKQEGDSTISLEEVRRRLAGLNGSLSELIIAERGEY